MTAVGTGVSKKTSLGQVIAGGWVSLIVMVKLQEGDPALSVRVTWVVPTGKKLPLAGVAVTVAPPPQPKGRLKLVTEPHWFASLAFVIFAGQERGVGHPPKTGTAEKSALHRMSKPDKERFIDHPLIVIEGYFMNERNA